MRTLLTAALVAIVANAANEFSSNSGTDFSNSASDESSSGKVPATPAPKPVLTPGCIMNSFGKGFSEYTDLNNYANLGPVDVVVDTSEVYALSPCGLQATNCTGNPMAYASFMVNDTCTDIFTVVKKSIGSGFDMANLTYTGAYQTADLKKTLTTVFKCSESEDGTTGVVTGPANDATLTVGSYKLCASTEQAPITLPAGQCTVDFTKYKGRTYKASLEGFDKEAKTIDGNAAAINTCGTGKTDFSKSTELTGCPATPGFMAFMDSTNTCVVLDVKESSYNPNTLVFTTNFSSTGATAAPKMLGATSDNNRVVVVECGATDSTNGKTTTKDGQTVITYTSTGACGEETPAAKKKDEGLSAGVIVAIVIGCVLVLIFLVLIIKCLVCGGKEEQEGEYNRV